MVKQKVVIIGGGVLGLFTALELLGGLDGVGGAGAVDGAAAADTESGTGSGPDAFDVTVVENAHPGEGSSGRSVGMVETQYFTAPAVEVRAYGRRAYAALERDHGLTFTHSGYLRLARTDADLERFAHSVEIQRRFGIDDAEVLTQQQLAERWPQLITHDLTGGLFGAWDGFVDGFETCQKLAALVTGRGGRVLTGAEVTAATREEGTWRIQAGAHRLNADIVVNAAGPHAGVIGNLLGAPVPLLPQLHGAVTLRLPSSRERIPFVMDYIPGSGTDGVYFRSQGDAHLIAGLHSEEAIAEAVDPDVAFRSVDPETVERIATLLMDRLNGADDLELDRSWQGIYPMTADHQPIVGHHPAAAGVVCAVGGGGNGIQLSPAIGRVAADAIRGTDGTTLEPAFELAARWSPGSPGRLSPGTQCVERGHA